MSSTEEVVGAGALMIATGCEVVSVYFLNGGYSVTREDGVQHEVSTDAHGDSEEKYSKSFGYVVH
jgi:hypothetical protein